jgi:L-ascorbate metabolism protein UlaG (beta-lactamase superfamily)
MRSTPAAAPDRHPVDVPDLDLGFVGHATVLLEVAGVRILTDPFLRRGLGPLERHGPVPDADALGDVDIVVVSHGHPDHFDLASLGAVRGRPVVVVPRGLGEGARRAVLGDVVEVAVGERVDFAPLRVTAVPARHWVSPGAPRAAPLGYLLDAGVRIYFAGDTGRYAGMRDLAGEVDVALLPVWTWGPHLGPGHLGPRSAAEVVADIRPALAVPIHWGTLYPRRLHHIWAGPLAEPGDRFASHAAQIAPGVPIRVLRPGETTHVSSASLPRRAR